MKRRVSNATLQVDCWNLCTLAKLDGLIETSVARPGVQGMIMDWYAYWMVHELKKYRVNKWFGQRSVCPVTDDPPVVSKDGIGIVLYAALTTAWRKAGEVWKAARSRILRAKLKLHKFKCDHNTFHPSHNCKYMN